MAETLEATRHSARLGWGMMAGLVVGWDILAKKTLSEEYSDALNRHPLAVRGLTRLTVAHLEGRIPEAIDPFKIFLNAYHAHVRNR